MKLNNELELKCCNKGHILLYFFQNEECPYCKSLKDLKEKFKNLKDKIDNLEYEDKD